MTAKYDFFRTPRPQEDGEVKYHARLVAKQTVGTRELARLIAARGAAREADVVGILISLADMLREKLADGHTVRLDGIGSFRVTAQSPLVGNVREIRAESIRFKNVAFTPEKALKRRLAGMEFERVPYTTRSLDLSGQQIDQKLEAYFAENDYITSRKMSELCGLSRMTAIRRLNERIREGRLSHPGTRNAPFYYPVPGHYGK